MTENIKEQHVLGIECWAVDVIKPQDEAPVNTRESCLTSTVFRTNPILEWWQQSTTEDQQVPSIKISVRPLTWCLRFNWSRFKTFSGDLNWKTCHTVQLMQYSSISRKILVYLRSQVLSSCRKSYQRTSNMTSKVTLVALSQCHFDNKV